MINTEGTKYSNTSRVTKSMNRTMTNNYNTIGFSNESVRFYFHIILIQNEEDKTLIYDGKMQILNRPHLVEKLIKSNKIKDYLKLIKHELVDSNINNY